MLFEHTDYRTILRERFGQRHARNPAYSMRAFARDLGISPSRLSEILSGKHALSAGKALAVAAKLALSPAEQSFFADLVQAESGRSELMRAQARARLVQHRAATTGDELTLEHFQVIANWYHFAILELAKVKGMNPSVTSIAATLGIRVKEARAALERLIRLGMLERKGRRLIVIKPKTRLRAEAPSDAIKSFHKEVLAMAMDALYFQTMQQRDFGSVVMAFDQERVLEAKAKLAAFRRDFAAEFTAKSGEASGVYCLALQFFEAKATC